MGVTLECGVTLSDVLYHRGTQRYSQITHTWPSKTMVDNQEHPRNSDEFIGSSSLATAFTTQTLSQDIYKQRECGSATRTRRTVCFHRNCPSNKESRFQQFGRDDGSHAAVLASHRTCPHKCAPRHHGHAEATRCSKTVITLNTS
jgi:hypothetical protein